MRGALHLFNIIATPSEVFTEVDSNPRCGMAMIVLVVVSLVIGWFMIPALEQPMRKAISSSFGEESADTVLESTMRYFLFLELLVEPLLKVIRWLVLTMLLYLLSLPIIEQSMPLFKRFFCAVVYGEVVFVYMNILTILIIYAKGIDTVESAADLTIFKGLEFFLQDKNPGNALYTLLSNINIFSIWYVVVISMAVRVMGRVTMGEGLSISCLAWIAWTVISISLPYLEGRVLSFVI